MSQVTAFVFILMIGSSYSLMIVSKAKLLGKNRLARSRKKMRSFHISRILKHGGGGGGGGGGRSSGGGKSHTSGYSYSSVSRTYSSTSHGSGGGGDSSSAYDSGSSGGGSGGGGSTTDGYTSTISSSYSTPDPNSVQNAPPGPTSGGGSLQPEKFNSSLAGLSGGLLMVAAFGCLIGLIVSIIKIVIRKADNQPTKMPAIAAGITGTLMAACIGVGTYFLIAAKRGRWLMQGKERKTRDFKIFTKALKAAGLVGFPLKLTKLLRKEDLSSINPKSPQSIYKFLRPFLKKHFGWKISEINQAIKLLPNFTAGNK